MKPHDYIAREDRFGAHNYHPLPVVLQRGEGPYVWDVEGTRYYDFLSAYSAVNQGHSHPRIVGALVDQARTLALTSRAFYNDQLGAMEEALATRFGYDKVLAMNSGAEAVETALKLARRWAYDVKGVPDNQALILVASQNFHGRTSTIVSFSSDPDSYGGFGPAMPGFQIIPYDDLAALDAALANPKVAAFLVEPIQGEAGVYVPTEGYISGAAARCKAANVLFMADEIQTGIGRTGAWLATCGACSCSGGRCERDPQTYVRADVLILGKALSGGVYPISAVLADDSVMLTIKPGQHGSTFGGNPVAARVAQVALDVVEDEQLMQRARRQGEHFRATLRRELGSHPLVGTVRGRGLLNAVVIHSPADSHVAWDLCLAMAAEGVLAKPTHGNIIRFAPPLVLTDAELDDALDRIVRSVKKFRVS
ncbi:MAG: ornithine--oxo-acid transaminase [Bacteroidota bacterium]|jgi:ornithine--oxo-acid transaminase